MNGHTLIHSEEEVEYWEAVGARQGNVEKSWLMKLLETAGLQDLPEIKDRVTEHPIYNHPQVLKEILERSMQDDITMVQEDQEDFLQMYGIIYQAEIAEEFGRVIIVSRMHQVAQGALLQNLNHILEKKNMNPQDRELLETGCRRIQVGYHQSHPDQSLLHRQQPGETRSGTEEKIISKKN